MNSFLMLALSLAPILCNAVDTFCNTGIKPNTYYTLSSLYGTNLATEIPKTEGGVISRSKAIHFLQADTDFEKWSFQKVPYARIQASAYAIVNKANGLVLTISNDSNDDGAEIILEPYTGRNSQLFKVTPDDGDNCYLQVVSSKLYLSNIGSGLLLGNVGEVQQTANWKSYNWNWKIIETPCDPFPNQPYRIIHRLSSMTLAIATGSTNESEGIKLAHQDDRAPYAQFIFTATEEYKNLFYITLRHSGKDLNIEDCQKTMGSPLVESHHSDQENSMFHLDTTKDGYCTLKAFHSERYVAPKLESDGQYTLGNILIQARQVPTLDTHFRLQRISFIPDANQNYRIRNIYSNKYIEVKVGSLSTGASIVQNVYDPKARYQLWTFVPHGNNSQSNDTQAVPDYKYYLRSNLTNMVIQVGQNESTGATQQNLGAANDYQLFKLDDTKDVTKSVTMHIYRIQLPNKFLALTPIDDIVGLNGTKIDLDNVAQEWEFELDV